jgi:hypothetical protein
VLDFINFYKNTALIEVIFENSYALLGFAPAAWPTHYDDDIFTSYETRVSPLRLVPQRGTGSENGHDFNRKHDFY